MGRYEERKKELDKLINKFILRSRNFIDYAAYNYGTRTLLITGEKTTELTYDHDYFNFVKSTKILLSIRLLLKENHNEDALILLRSMFESYMAARFLNENEEMVEEFIFYPTMYRLDYYNLNHEKGVLEDRNKQEIGKMINPSQLKTGKDKKYYYDFYKFLCLFAHSNYFTSPCYCDKDGTYNLFKENYSIEVRLYTVFVFTKLFEHVVTVEGEEFPSREVEKDCYKLVKESLEFQKIVFEEVIQAHKKNKDEVLKHINKGRVKMLKEMKKSLIEELGSIKKEN